MTYRIDNSARNPQRIELKESPVSRRILGGVFLVVGAAALLMGLLSLELPQGHILAGSGVAFFCAGLLVLTQFNNPPTLTFDNTAKALVIAPPRARTGSASATLPYAEIAGFEMHRHVSVTSGRSRTTQYTCSMIRKDGARWALMTSSSKDAADKFCQELTARVDLKGASSANTPAEPPAFVEVSRTSEGTVIRWKKRVSSGSMVLFLGLLAGIGIAGWGSWLAIGAVSLAATVMLLGWLTSARTWQTVQLGGGLFRYREEGSPFKWTSFDKPLEGIATVLFQFSPNEKAAMLLVIDREQRDALASLGKGSDPDPMQVAGLLFSLRRIGLGEMGVGDLLRLERFLEAKIEEARAA